jgi:hypothetical protein
MLARAGSVRLLLRLVAAQEQQLELVLHLDVVPELRRTRVAERAQAQIEKRQRQRTESLAARHAAAARVAPQQSAQRVLGDARHRLGQDQRDADLGGTLSGEADVRRGGEDVVDPARALFGTVAGVLKQQPRNRWKWVSLKLKS